jgi:hypothetical protein
MSEHTDPRPDRLKVALADHWSDHADEYRDADNYPGSTVLFEDDQVAIVADHSQSVLSRLTLPGDMPVSALKTWSKEAAQDIIDDVPADADIICFDKYDR